VGARNWEKRRCPVHRRHAREDPHGQANGWTMGSVQHALLRGIEREIHQLAAHVVVVGFILVLRAIPG
jgi:hypothetical protein